MNEQVGSKGPYSLEEKTSSLASLKKNRKKFWIAISAFLALFVLLVGYIGWQAFSDWYGRRQIDLLYESLKREQEELYQRQLADTWGGKTPQETLRLYIEAVEKGDYELASKYFVIEKQEEEWRKLENSPAENTKNILDLLKVSLISPGSFSADGKGFVVRRPLLVDFVLYPNGIWKIVEI